MQQAFFWATALVLPIFVDAIALAGVEDGKICSCFDVDAHLLPNREDPLA